MAHADQGKQQRTQPAKAKSRRRQLVTKRRFDRRRAAPTRQPDRAAPTIESGRQLPELDVQDLPGTFDLLQDITASRVTNLQPDRPPTLGFAPSQPGTEAGNISNLSPSQQTQFQTLLDNGLPRDTALRAAMQGPRGGVPTGGELLRGGLQLGSLLFGGQRPALQNVGAELARTFGGPDRDSRAHFEAVADARGLTGRERDDFIRSRQDESEADRALNLLGEETAAQVTPPTRTSTSPLANQGISGTGRLLQRGLAPVTPQRDLLEETAGTRRFAGAGDFAGSADALAKQVANWDYNIDLMEERIFDAASPPNYLNRLMLEDLFEAQGLTPEQVEAFLKDWGYERLSEDGEIYHSVNGTAYVSGQGFPDPDFTGGGGGGSVGVGGGGSIFGGGGRGGGGRSSRPALGGASAGLYNWRITA